MNVGPLLSVRSFCRFVILSIHLSLQVQLPLGKLDAKQETWGWSVERFNDSSEELGLELH